MLYLYFDAIKNLRILASGPLNFFVSSAIKAEPVIKWSVSWTQALIYPKTW